MTVCPVFRLLAVLLLATTAPSVAAAATLELTDCRISAGPGAPSMKARCATMPRPLDPSGGVAGEIELRVAVVPALNLTPAADPFVPIAGGPGQSSIEFFAAYASAFAGVRRNRDIVLVDQRGTGDSTRLDCAIDDGVVEGQFSVEQTAHYTKECLGSLQHDPRFFTSSIAVGDLEAVREALGYPALNLYGISYGTRVAQHYARRYAASTRSVVLDGVVPPNLSLGPEIATESQRAVDRILGRCEEDAGCRERFPDLRPIFDRVLESLRAEAVEIDVANPTTGRVEALSLGDAEFGVAIRLLAYHPSTIAMMPLLIHEAGNGNFAPLGAQYSLTLTSLTDQIALG